MDKDSKAEADLRAARKAIAAAVQECGPTMQVWDLLAAIVSLWRASISSASVAIREEALGVAADRLIRLAVLLVGPSRAHEKMAVFTNEPQNDEPIRRHAIAYIRARWRRDDAMGRITAANNAAPGDLKRAATQRVFAEASASLQAAHDAMEAAVRALPNDQPMEDTDENRR